MKLSVVIVSYNTKNLLDKCIESLNSSVEASSVKNSTEIIVVDNNSTDGSVEFIKKKYKAVEIIVNDKNIGFGAANNLGINKAKGEIILLLNSDTILIPSTIESSINELTKHKADILGPSLLNPDNSIQQSAGYFPNILRVFAWMLFIDNLPLFYNFIKPYHVKRESFYKSVHWVDWVTGAYFLAKKKVFDNNLFDPNVFMYVEEVELCYRIKKNGYKIVYSPFATLTHLKGASGAGSEAGIKEELYGIEYFYKKHHNIISRLIVKLFLIVGALLRIFIFGIIQKSEKRKKYYLEYLKLAG